MTCKVVAAALILMSGAAHAGETPVLALDYEVGLGLVGSEMRFGGFPFAASARVIVRHDQREIAAPFVSLGFHDERYSWRWEPPRPHSAVPPDILRSVNPRTPPIAVRAALYELAIGVRLDGRGGRTRRFAELSMGPAIIDQGSLGSDLHASFAAGVGWPLGADFSLWVTGEQRLYLKSNYLAVNVSVNLEFEILGGASRARSSA